MIKILIVDDEQSAGRILKVLLEKHIPGDKQIEISNHPTDALEMLKTYQPSLVMLDIEMPGMNGFDFLNRASEWSFDVIFTTAYDQYAIKAIRFSALDYLLKPIDILDLQNAVNRHIVKRQNSTVSSQQPLVDNLIYNLQQKDQQQAEERPEGFQDSPELAAGGTHAVRVVSLEPEPIAAVMISCSVHWATGRISASTLFSIR